MPLSQDDVLNVLDDTVVTGLDFSVGPIRINGSSYRIIRQHILAGNIQVVPGDQSLAFYNNQTDILTTQVGQPPLDLNGRALLLHECTHALADIFNSGKATRHTDELAAYLVQHIYMLRSDPKWDVGPNNLPWYMFFKTLVEYIKSKRLDTVAGNGAVCPLAELEGLRILLASLPYVNYKNYRKDDPTGANELLKKNPLVSLGLEVGRGGVSVKIDWVRYADPRDDGLIKELEKFYDAADVAGYRSRLVYLRANFALCPLGRAKELRSRLTTRQRGDRLSELFYDRLSAGGRALLLRVLDDRI